jgi:hypothetical protein
MSLLKLRISNESQMSLNCRYKHQKPNILGLYILQIM